MRTWFKILFWVGGVLGVLLLALRAFVFDVWTVPADDPMLSAAIEPTLSAGDMLVLTRRSEVQRGNLLRCADPQAPGRFIVARAIARWGEQVEISDEIVSVDNHHPPSPRACDPPKVTMHDPQTDEDDELACSIEDYGDTTYEVMRSTRHVPEAPVKQVVQPGLWFLLSDDRHIHVDSRDFGEVDPRTCQHIVGRIQSAAGLGDAKKRFTVVW